MVHRSVPRRRSLCDALRGILLKKNPRYCAGLWSLWVNSSGNLHPYAIRAVPLRE
ncbi:Hypothetical protein ETEE_2387 [Edwardsiella anguillarum ET080813]|uniref:Uncharacterized protein n=1 Tax=Edwardsiella anguillarum ET080813 TaxID=667120 RepID=A0A076LQI1_9GAMM|nr:Hypothetical protein ETEE_2387 [Edwardsiella anguillarum ET080813]